MQKSFLLYFSLVFGTIFHSLGIYAQGGAGVDDSEIKPEAVLFMENGFLPEEPVTLTPGDTYSGAAPLEFRFSANPPTDSSSLRFEWQFATNPGFDDIILTRFDEETTYRFEKTGTYYIRVLCTDVDTEMTFESDVFAIQITESILKVPNAFSPNGDGVNDIFKVQHKSLVRFNAAVFNRWGQELYQWNLSNIDEGWDGKANGKQVKEGVYFIIIEAEGADGVIYKHKGDINILR